MYKIIFLLCLFFLNTGCTKSQITEQESTKHFLWKVSDADSYVWILGSIHMADSTFYPLDPVIMNAFNESQALVLEIDISNDSVLNESSSLSMDRGVLPSGQLLKDVLPDSTYMYLDSLFRSWGLSIDLFKNFRPWMVAMQISAMAIERTGFSSEWGIEYMLMDQAVLLGKEIVSLETPATQIEALATPSDTLGVYYLETTLKEISQIDSLLSQIAFAWQTGNRSKLQSLLNPKSQLKSDKEKEMDNVIKEKIYSERNIGMVNRIESFIKENKKFFIAVGVAHLIEDDDNILELLKNKGFKVDSF